MKLTKEQVQELIEKGQAEIPAKHTGWTSTIRFNRWTKYGKDRLYYSFSHTNRHGKPSGHSKGKGFINVQTGEVEAPPSDRGLIRNLVV
jgi:hypothetical protein